MKTIIALLFTCIGFVAYSQTDLNNYKYIIVPKKFDAFKSDNAYQTSTLIKYLFTGKGFNVVYDDALPEELNSNRCLGLLADLEDDSSMFTTKNSIILKDCNDKEVYRTMQGVSKEKEYKAAYNETIREAMRSFNGMDYAYSGNGNGNGNKNKNETITVSFKNDVKNLKDSKTEKANKIESKEKETKTVKSSTINQVATESDQYYKNNQPVDSNIKKESDEKPAFKSLKPKKLNVEDILYAQATDNGFQLVDNTPKIRMKLLKSSSDNVFMAQSEAKNGMVYQKEGKWIFEYYDNGELVQEELNIKF